jgi:hypothetical protein
MEEGFMEDNRRNIYKKTIIFLLAKRKCRENENIAHGGRIYGGQ